MSYFGQNIKKIRTVKNLSQQAFADTFKLKRAAVGSWEEGRAEPKSDTMIEIADFFSISLDSLLRKEITVNELQHFRSIENQLLAVEPLIKQSGTENKFADLTLIAPEDWINGEMTFKEPSDFLHREKIKLPGLKANMPFMAPITESCMDSGSGLWQTGNYAVCTFVPHSDVKQGLVYAVFRKNNLVFGRAEIYNETSIIKPDNLNFQEFKIEDSDKIALVVGLIAYSNGFPQSKIADLEQRLADLEQRMKT